MNYEEELERLKNKIDILSIQLSVVASKQKTLNIALYDALGLLPKEEAEKVYTKYVIYLERHFASAMKEMHLLSNHSKVDFSTQLDQYFSDMPEMKQSPYYRLDPKEE